MTSIVGSLHLLALLATGVVPGGGRDTLTAEEILERAIEVQRHHEEAGNEVKFDYELVSITEKLDKHGEVKETETRLFHSNHIENVAYERLVEKDGRPLTEKEAKKEHERERKFREKLAKGEARHNDADERVAFDEELMARYDVALVSRPHGAGSYVLSFSPKEGKLPNRRRIDRVLNKAAGKLWVDAETFQVARVEFELTEKVKLWWGMIGSVSAMRGAISRAPVDSEVWLPDAFDFYIKGRVLFRSFHVRQKVTWAEFRSRSIPAATESVNEARRHVPRVRRDETKRMTTEH